MPKNIGKTLKEYRIAAKISVKEISEILTKKGFKASEKTIYSWESGNSSPSPDALLAMCSAYNIEDVLTAFGYDGYNEDGSICLNMREIDIVEKYRDLDAHGREMVDFTLEKEYERSKALEEQNGNNIVNMPSHLEVNAAHHSHGGFTDEEHQEDEDMLD